MRKPCGSSRELELEVEVDMDGVGGFGDCTLGLGVDATEVKGLDWAV